MIEPGIVEDVDRDVAAPAELGYSGRVSTNVADVLPLRHLVPIGIIDILPPLFGRVLSPDIVGAELGRPSTPLPVRSLWIDSRRRQ